MGIWAVEYIAEMYGVSVHLYTDDTQSLNMNDPDDIPPAKSLCKQCIAHIATWMKKKRTRTIQK